MGSGDKIVEEVGRFLEMLLGKPLTELSLLATDQISFWRLKNQIRILQKAKAYLKKRGIDPKKIAGSVLPDTVVPLLEAGSDSSDPILTDLFAALLASSADPGTSASTHKSFVAVLKQLSPLDAKILFLLYRTLSFAQHDIAQGEHHEGYNDKQALHRQLFIDEEDAGKHQGASAIEARISFQNLRRLGLCDHGGDVLDRANQLPVISFTDYGISFMGACAELSKDQPRYAPPEPGSLENDQIGIIGSSS